MKAATVSLPEYEGNFTRILKVTLNKEYPEQLVIGIALKGLSAPILQIVMPQNRKTLEDLRLAAILAEKDCIIHNCQCSFCE